MKWRHIPEKRKGHGTFLYDFWPTQKAEKVISKSELKSLSDKLQVMVQRNAKMPYMDAFMRGKGIFPIQKFRNEKGEIIYCIDDNVAEIRGKFSKNIPASVSRGVTFWCTAALEEELIDFFPALEKRVQETLLQFKMMNAPNC